MSELEKLTLPEIRELIEANDSQCLREILNEWQPQDIADLLEDLAPTEQEFVLAALEPEKAARTFEHISPAAQEALMW